jgi:hypothetical protein
MSNIESAGLGAKSPTYVKSMKPEFNVGRKVPNTVSNGGSVLIQQKPQLSMTKTEVATIQTLKGVLFNINKVTPITAPPITTRGFTVKKQESRQDKVNQQMQNVRSKTVQSSSFLYTTGNKPIQRQIPKQILEPVVKPRDTLKTPDMSFITITDKKTKQVTGTVQIQEPIKTTQPDTKQDSSSLPKLPTPPTSNIPIFQAPPLFSPGVSFGSGGFSGNEKPKKKSKKRKYRYTPSLQAVAFGIKGKAPKGQLTGLEFRPIPSSSKTRVKLK